MKTTDAILEYLIPGVLVIAGFLLGFIALSNLSHQSHSFIMVPFQIQGIWEQGFFLFLFLSVSYLAGVLANNLAGRIFKKKVHEIRIAAFEKLKSQLTKPFIESLLPECWNKKDEMNVNDIFCSIRVQSIRQCRESVEGLYSHLKVLRLLRSSFVPIVVLTLGGAIYLFSLSCLGFKWRILWLCLLLIVGYGSILIAYEGFTYRHKIYFRDVFHHFISHKFP